MGHFFKRSNPPKLQAKWAGVWALAYFDTTKVSSLIVSLVGKKGSSILYIFLYLSVLALHGRKNSRWVS